MESLSLARRKTPEEREYEKKLAELTALESEVSELELELATLCAELDAFGLHYQQALGSLIAELDTLMADVAEVHAKMNPNDQSSRKHADACRQRAQESSEAMGWAQEHANDAKVFRPTEELKRLYREAAKTLHPDLATNEDERLRRQRFMAEANDAYKCCDIERLCRILQEWEASPESVRGNDIAAELIRIIRKIAQMETRLESINAELVGVKNSELYQLMAQTEQAKLEEKDLLEEMAEHLKERIAAERIRKQLLQNRT